MISSSGDNGSSSSKHGSTVGTPGVPGSGAVVTGVVGVPGEPKKRSALGLGEAQRGALSQSQTQLRASYGCTRELAFRTAPDMVRL
jgi:hypothetical protein